MILAGAVTVFAGLSLAQMGTFIGRVIGADGKPQKDVVIKIERTDIKGNWKTKSNKKGEWIYSGMQSGGRYSISCEVDGKVMDTVNGVRAQMGEPVEIDVCNLQKVAAKNAAMQKAMETGLDGAAAELDKAAALNPTGAGQYYFNLGAIMVNTGQNDAAVGAFKKCTEADPKYANCWYYYGNTLSGKMVIQGEKVIPPDGMVAALEKYLELDPNGANAAAAQGLLSTVTTTVETKYVNPDAKKAPGKKKK